MNVRMGIILEFRFAFEAAEIVILSLKMNFSTLCCFGVYLHAADGVGDQLFAGNALVHAAAVVVLAVVVFHGFAPSTSTQTRFFRWSPLLESHDAPSSRWKVNSTF